LFSDCSFNFVSIGDKEAEEHFLFDQKDSLMSLTKACKKEERKETKSKEGKKTGLENTNEERLTDKNLLRNEKTKS